MVVRLMRNRQPVMDHVIKDQFWDINKAENWEGGYKRHANWWLMTEGGRWMEESK